MVIRFILEFSGDIWFNSSSDVKFGQKIKMFYTLKNDYFVNISKDSVYSYQVRIRYKIRSSSGFMWSSWIKSDPSTIEWKVIISEK